MSYIKLTAEEKKERLEKRRELKKLEDERARIETEKNQSEISEIEFSIEWKKSYMYGHNPFLTAYVSFKNGTFEKMTATCTSSGYDKESTVIAEIFNKTLKYKLYKPEIMNDKENKPYGVYISDNKRFSGGIGTDCYFKISEFIKGKFERIASGSTFDVYKYTDLSD